METSILFNRGNALASKTDKEELMKKVQVEKDRRGIDKKLVIVEDEKGEYLLFDFSDAETDNKEADEFKITHVFENEEEDS